MKKELKKQLFDQSSHMAVAMLFLSPLIAAPSLLTAMFAGLGLGLLREITEEGNPVSWEKVKAAVSGTNSKVDIAFWSLGAALAYLLFA